VSTVHIVVDMLYDFIDGSLACLNAENAIIKSIEFINSNKNHKVIYVADSHPANHCSFRDYGGIWPAHCVKGTRGEKIHEKFYTLIEDLSSRPADDNILRKGEDFHHEQYSGFEAKSDDNHTLGEYLRNLGAEDIIISGITTEYCVNETTRDLLRSGFRVSLILDGLSYITPESHRETIEELKKLGAKVI
jgi:nicotinamidase-related amidase